jgi:hypothetical protein
LRRSLAWFSSVSKRSRCKTTLSVTFSLCYSLHLPTIPRWPSLSLSIPVVQPQSQDFLSRFSMTACSNPS